MPTATLSRDLPAAALNEERRAEIIGDLNTNLAHLLDLAAASKEAHWNVRGPNFQGLHELFDLITAEVRTFSDEVAERLVTLGGTAHGTIQDTAANSTLPRFPSDERDWETLTVEVHGRMLATAERIRHSADETEDDLATQDLYVEVMRGVEKRAWMLDAHLQRSR